MIQPGKTQSPLKRPKQRKVGVELRTLLLVNSVIGVHNCYDFVDDGLHRIIILVPDHNDCVASASPDRRSADGGHQFLDRLVAENDERRVQTCLRAVAAGIIVTKCAGIATSMLVVALVGRNQRKSRHIACPEIGPESAFYIKCRHVAIAVERVSALLYVAKIGERIVLHGIELNDVRAREWRIQYWFDLDEICEITEIPITVIHPIWTGDRQIFLITLPGLSMRNQLIGDGYAERCGNGGVRDGSVNIDLARRPSDFVRTVQCRGRRVGTASPEGTDRRALRVVGIRNTRRKVGGAGHIVPVWRVIAMDAEIRSTDDLEIISEAGMRDRKIIGGQVRSPRVLVDKAGVRVVYDFFVTVIFHHYEEHVIEMWNSFGDGAFLSQCSACEVNGQAHDWNDFFLDG